MTFSLLHTSARPGKWPEIYAAWKSAASDWNSVQYILVGDERWGFPRHYNDSLSPLRPPMTDVYTMNKSRQCYVDGVNTAARYATGDVLIVIADDQYPAPDWDIYLREFLKSPHREDGQFPGEFLLRVPTGTQDEITRNTTVMPILSRSRHERLGYVFYPGYESMYADNDISEHAQLDGVFIEAPANFPVFPHRHPFFTDAPMDEAYAQQNRKEAYDLGSAILQVRRALGFGTGKLPNPSSAPAPRKTIAVCLPGETFSSIWVSSWTELFVNLFSRYNVVPIFCFSSNVHATRGTLAQQILSLPTEPDYVLWIDDDNPVNWSHVSRLISDLEENQSIDAVAGWCYIHDPLNSRYVASCGVFGDFGKCVNYTDDTFVDSDQDLIPIQFTGFPLLLTRGVKTLKTAPHPFAPIIELNHPYGAMSEDTSFCLRAWNADLTFFVDRRVKVDHLKLGPLGPPSAYSSMQPAPAASQETELPAAVTA